MFNSEKNREYMASEIHLSKSDQNTEKERSAQLALLDGRGELWEKCTLIMRNAKKRHSLLITGMSGKLPATVRNAKLLFNYSLCLYRRLFGLGQSQFSTVIVDSKKSCFSFGNWQKKSYPVIFSICLTVTVKDCNCP